jgi:hypothetical protein
MTDSPTMPTDSQPNTQGDKSFRRHMPAWIQELPTWRFRPEEPVIDSPLIDRATLDALLVDVDPDVVKRIKDDIQFLDYELLRLFRIRDYEAKKQQNRHRKYQISYLALATGAAALGSFQALAVATNPQLMQIFAFGETLIALFATYMATLGSREPPLNRWLDNRRRAEELRREYFLFLMNLAPYDALMGYERKVMLSKRAAEINRGVFPSDTFDSK